MVIQLSTSLSLCLVIIYSHRLRGLGIVVCEIKNGSYTRLIPESTSKSPCKETKNHSKSYTRVQSTDRPVEDTLQSGIENG